MSTKQTKPQALARLAGMSEEEKLKWREEKAVRVGARKQTTQEKKARLEQVRHARVLLGHPLLTFGMAGAV